MKSGELLTFHWFSHFPSFFFFQNFFTLLNSNLVQVKLVFFRFSSLKPKLCERCFILTFFFSEGEESREFAARIPKSFLDAQGKVTKGDGPDPYGSPSRSDSEVEDGITSVGSDPETHEDDTQTQDTNDGALGGDGGAPAPALAVQPQTTETGPWAGMGVACFNCGFLGHLARDCPTPPYMPAVVAPPPIGDNGTVQPQHDDGLAPPTDVDIKEPEQVDDDNDLAPPTDVDIKQEEGDQAEEEDGDGYHHPLPLEKIQTLLKTDESM